MPKQQSGNPAGGDSRRRAGPGQRYSETAKVRSSRVPLGYLSGGTLGRRVMRFVKYLREYVRSGDRMAVIRDVLFLAAVVVAVPLGVLLLVWESVGTLSGVAPQQDPVRRIAHSSASPGELALVHASFDDECWSCHVPHQPMKQAHWSTDLLSLKDVAANERCVNCHPGPPHHQNQKGFSEQACAHCHVEHRGRLHSLVRLADRMCIDCHANLAQHMIQNSRQKTAAQLHVTKFTVAEHPEFRLLMGSPQPLDPGTLKFNHKLHMTAGMGRTPDVPLFRYSDIKDAEWRSIYTKSHSADSADEFVQLHCDSCHQFDRSQRDAAQRDSVPVGIAGAYSRPIVYEKHCQACHPLAVPLNPTAQLAGLVPPRDDNPDDDSEQAAESMRTIIIPHGVQPSEINELLVDKLIAALLSPPAERELPKLRMPGVTADDESDDSAKQTVLQAIAEDLSLAQKMLFTAEQTCRECHHYETTAAGSVKLPVADDDQILHALSKNQLEIKPPNVPRVWYATAHFNHAAHRAYDCSDCHAAAKDGSVTSADVMLPGIEKCVECHSPLRFANGQRRGGVRHGCTDCHGFHSIDLGVVMP